MTIVPLGRLQSIIKKLQRAQFGRRSERLDADQLALALKDLDGDIAPIRESRPIVGRARTFCSQSPVISAAVVVVRSMPSAKASARCWTGCRRSFV
jgi:hypothetical protein